MSHVGYIGLVILVIRLPCRGPLYLLHGHLLDRLGSPLVRVPLLSTAQDLSKYTVPTSFVGIAVPTKVVGI